MILRLEVPYLETAVRGGTIVSWDKGEGDEVAFGERICSIMVDEWLSLRRDKRASKLSSVMSAKRASKENRFEWRQNRGSLTLEVIASEPCTIRKIQAVAGTKVALSDTIALVSNRADDALDATDDVYKSHPTLRVIARPTQTEEVDQA